MGKKELTMSGSMTLKTIVKTTVLDFCVFRWCIFNYSLLQLDRLYCQAFMGNGFNYFYKLIKQKGRLYIGFQCEYANTPGTFFLMDGNHIVQQIEATEVADALYIGEFPESLFLGTCQNAPDNAYRKDGPVNIAFRFLSNYSSSVQYNPVGQIGLQADFDELCHNIQSMYIDSVTPDFTLKFGDTTIKVHKSILYARSKFFKEFFEKDEDATEFSLSETTPMVMYEALLYIYGGELCNSKLESVLDVLKVAYLLNIPSLKEICLDYFDEIDAWEVIESEEFFQYKIEE